MKKLILGAILLLFSGICFGQNHFLNTTLEKAKDRWIKVIQLSDECKNFYTSSSFETVNRIQYSTLIGSVFKVSYSYAYNSNKGGGEKQIIALETVGDNSKSIYYDYDQYKYLSLPFKFVSEKGTELSPNELLCDEIEITTDKYSDEKKISSPDLNDISFIKSAIKGKSYQYVSIYTYGSIPVVNEKGLVVLFKSGKKIIRPNEKVSVDVSSRTGTSYSYHVFFTPTINEIQLLKKEEIVGVKLYIFENDISEGERLKQYANCVLITPKVKKK